MAVHLLRCAAECSTLGHEVAYAIPVGGEELDRRQGWIVVECKAPEAAAVSTLWERVESARRAEASGIVEREIFTKLAATSTLAPLTQYFKNTY